MRAVLASRPAGAKAERGERHLVVPGEEGTIAHAQLTVGGGMIMLGSARDDEFGKLQKPPAAAGGVATQSAYIIVPDADAHHARAVAAGAKVVYALKDEDHGGRGYSCLDPEGHPTRRRSSFPRRRATGRS